MTRKNRPLSPHVQVYRPQLTSVMSITHRMSGLALAAGAVMLVFWLSSAAYGADMYHVFTGFLNSWLGRVLLFAWSAALFYHLSNGVRHLLWDMGCGLEIPQVYRSGYAVLAATAILTGLAWAVGLSG